MFILFHKKFINTSILTTNKNQLTAKSLPLFGIFPDTGEFICEILSSKNKKKVKVSKRQNINQTIFLSTTLINNSY